ncbi:uncharacterized protein TNCV_2775191 [Trichonephila clavipes]|nr:uncharacterized protein TNCV_2775191 [Trichonephila clavipes]
MPPNTLPVHTESVGPKVLWIESRVQGTGEYSPPLQFHVKIMEVEISGVVIYRPFEFRRANSFCHLNACVKPSDDGLAETLKYTWNLMDIQISTDDCSNMTRTQNQVSLVAALSKR